MILVAGATYRCGSTLIQRLLNTSEECMIWGEDQFSLPMFTQFLSRLNGSTMNRAKEQRELFKENKDCWSSNLLPPYYIHTQAVYNFLQTLYNDGQKPAFRIGFKQLYPSTKEITTFFQCGGTKLIYCYRNLKDAHESYKNIYGFYDEEKLQNLYDQLSKPIIEALVGDNPSTKKITDSVFFVDFDDINIDTINDLFDWLGIENRSNIKKTLSNNIREVENYSPEKYIEHN